MGIVAKPYSALEDIRLKNGYGSSTKQQLWVEPTAHCPITWLCVSNSIIIFIYFYFYEELIAWLHNLYVLRMSNNLRFCVVAACFATFDYILGIYMYVCDLPWFYISLLSSSSWVFCIFASLLLYNLQKKSAFRGSIFLEAFNHT